MSLLPVAVYTLEVPCGGILVPATADFPATFRLTMAAIDPSAEPETVEGITRPRATLKIIRQPISEQDDEDEDDEEYMRALIGGSDSESDDEDEESDEESNGGPSDPAKTKKARKAAAVKQLIESLKADDSDEEMEGTSDAKGKGKAATDDDEEDSEEGSDDDEEEELELEEFVLCTLDPEKNYQQTLDIVVGENEEVFFKVDGTHTIFLTGNYVIPQDDGHNHHHEVYDSDEDSDDDEDDEDYDLSPDEDELELDLEDDESDALDGLDNPRVTEVDSEDEAPKLVKGAESKKGKNKRSADEIEEPVSLDEIISKANASEEPKLSKKQLKKLKKNNGEAATAKDEEITTPAGKSDKKVQFAKNLEQGPTGSAEKPKVAGTPIPAKAAAKPEPEVKTINGVKIEDKKVGTGPAAKNGDKVEMRYIGKLQSGKVFDSNKSGKAFGFKLGKGEVIKGWEIGIAGMKVNGERRLTVPAKLAYGSKANGAIPANSTLIFDVKLLSIK